MKLKTSRWSEISPQSFPLNILSLRCSTAGSASQKKILIQVEDQTVDAVWLPSDRGMSKVPTIATDCDLANMEERRGKKEGCRTRLNPRKARALRRKLYLELYCEAAKKGFI